MKLFIQQADGTLEEVMDDLEKYDLDRPLGRAVFTEEVQQAIKRVKVYNDLHRPNTDDALNRAIHGNK